ncbi:MAG: 50S ribosome-binding GTPase [Limnochordales bacterium]|nr:50S ribosome-binding GTPase [Limnochordales bacterium]
MGSGITSFERWLGKADLVVEVADARLPFTSRHRLLCQLVHTGRLLVLSRADLADPTLTATWVSFWRQQGEKAFAAALVRRGEALRVLRAVMQMAGRAPLTRVVVAGLPNVGKSFLINQWIGSSRLRTGNRPGVTTGPQWVRVADGLTVLDTPGVLEPVAREPEERLALACLGLLAADKYDPQEAAAWLVKRLAQSPAALATLARRWFWQPAGEIPEAAQLLEELALARSYLLPGGVADAHRAALQLLTEFRQGRLGRITLEVPPASTIV